MMCVLAIYVTYGVENENSSSTEAKGWVAGAESRNVTVA